MRKENCPLHGMAVHGHGTGSRSFNQNRFRPVKWAKVSHFCLRSALKPPYSGNSVMAPERAFGLSPRKRPPLSSGAASHVAACRSSRRERPRAAQRLLRSQDVGYIPLVSMVRASANTARTKMPREMRSVLGVISTQLFSPTGGR
jgi:hypothetical protein